MPSSSTSDSRIQKIFRYTSNRYWVNGHSFYLQENPPKVRFACRMCDTDLTYVYDFVHCWDCMSKYCKKCWSEHEYGGPKCASTCPEDGQGSAGYKEKSPPE